MVSTEGTSAGNLSVYVADLEGWLHSLRTIEGVLRIRLAKKTCELAVDYSVIHDYVFPSRRDILSDVDSIKEKTYQNHIRCGMILNWLPERWEQSLILLSPHKIELARHVEQIRRHAEILTWDQEALKAGINNFIKDVDRMKELDCETLDDLNRWYKPLYLAITLGTRQSVAKLKQLIMPREKEAPRIRIDSVSGIDENDWNAIGQHRAEIERTADEVWRPIFEKQVGRKDKHISNRLDSIALECVRFINSRWNAEGNALILISGARSFLGALSQVKDNQRGMRINVDGEREAPIWIPYVASPDFFSFYLSDAVSETGQLLEDKDILDNIIDSRKGLESALGILREQPVLKKYQGAEVFQAIEQIVRNQDLNPYAQQTLLESKEFLASFLKKHRATLLYSSGIGEHVPEFVREHFQASVNDLEFAKKRIQDRYSEFINAVGETALDEKIGQLTEDAIRHVREILEVSAIWSFIEKVPQSLNYGFIYENTRVEDQARIIFGSARRKERSAEVVEGPVQHAFEKVRDLAESGEAHAYLLLAHVKTKVHDASYDEAALKDLATGRRLLKEDEQDIGYHFEFVKNIANYHLHHLELAIENSERLVATLGDSTPRFCLQAGFFYWCRYQQEPDNNKADLEKAIELANQAEKLSRDDVETNALALANRARAQAEKARLAKTGSDEQSRQWKDAIQGVKAAEEKCRLRYESVEEWPACIAYAIAYVWYEHLRSLYDPRNVTSERAIEAAFYFEDRLQWLVPVIDGNRRWQSTMVAKEYRKLIRQIRKWKTALDRNMPEVPKG